MRPWLPEISFFDDVVPHGAAMNMAIDEALLRVIPGPVLRVYRWARPAVSFGYFERWEPIRAAHPDREAVRRWTGGGVVLHGVDFTYSLLIPRGGGVEERTPADSYGIIHGALCRALQDAGIPAQLAPSSAKKTSQACFENPVLHDVLVWSDTSSWSRREGQTIARGFNPGEPASHRDKAPEGRQNSLINLSDTTPSAGRKVAGAAQRRTRGGLIHQGSVQGLNLPGEFGEGFGAWLGEVMLRQSFDVTLAAENLAAEKYATRAWMERRR